MPWLKVSCLAASERIDDWSARLERAGAQAVSIEDAHDTPLFDELDGRLPVWEESVITGLFEAGAGEAAIRSALALAFDDTTAPEFRLETLPDEDWQRSWMERYQPLDCGHGLWICPTWLEPPDPEAINVLMDPGLAFGSGTHETTGLCLEWLAAHRPVDKDIIDYGCGSGILAIAALRLGARHALGVDIDPQALRASVDNAQRNAVAGQLDVCLPTAMPEQVQADIVFANILAGTLVSLREQLLAMRRDGGVLVLSGILREQLDEVRGAYRAGNLIEVYERGDWIMLTVRRQTAPCAAKQGPSSVV